MALAWLVFPVYGEGIAVVLPTADSTMRWVFPIIAVGVQLGSLWSGARGGPMSVSRASIIHELGAPVPAKRVLAPQLLRQAVAWGTGAAMVGGVLTSFGNNFGFAAAAVVSAACFLLLFAAVMWAYVFMVGVRTTETVRGAYLGSSVVTALAVSVVVVVSRSITDAPAFAVLGVAAVTGSAIGWHALDRVPVPSAWQRARNLESARSAMLEVDFHRMMIDLRGAGDDKAEGETRLPPNRGLSLWRGSSPIRHALPWSAIRLAAGVAAALLLLVLAPLDQGAVLLAIGGVWLVLGYELTRGIAAVADQVSLLFHYPRSSFRLLAGQLGASLLMGATLIGLVHGWWFIVDRTAALIAVIVASMGVMGGAMQARLGSPDTTAMVDQHGLEFASAILWARAAAAPLAVFTTIVLAFHGFELQPLELEFELGFDLAGPARWLIAVLFLISVVVSLRPLEKAAR